MEQRQALQTIEELRKAHAFVIEREAELAKGRNGPAAEPQHRVHTHGMTR